MYIFVSTSSGTLPIAEKVVSHVETKHHNTFYFKRDILPGESFPRRMAEGLDSADIVLCLVSPKYVLSDFCMVELETAFILHKLLVMKVEKCPLPKMYEVSVFIDLPTVGEEMALCQLGDLLDSRDGQPSSHFRPPFQYKPRRGVNFEKGKGVKMYNPERYRPQEAAPEGEYFRRGIELAWKGHYEEAITELTAAIEHGEQGANPYFNRGVIRLEIGEYSGALDDFTEVIQLDPEFMSAFVQRSRALRYLGYYAEALNDLSVYLAENSQ